jgi:indolepyruvate ferredoxin oxidoreductase alpha subunit
MPHIKNDQQFLSGNEAIARGAWEAGLRVACAYPGTPSTEILETLATFNDIDTQWSVNEKVAYEVAAGAAYGGVRSLFACKHVGLNVAMDPLMTSSYTGINGGFVVVVADDPGMHSSQNEQDTRWVGPYSKLPILEPADPSEAYAYVKNAYEISERFDTPVIVRMTTRVSHSKENLMVGSREEITPKPFATDIRKYVMVPANARRRHVVVEQRQVDLAAYAEQSPLNVVCDGDRSIGFITSGETYHYIKEKHSGNAVLKLGMVWPLCENKIRRFIESVEKAYVVEELDPFLETMIQAMGMKVAAKDPSFRVDELKPEYIPAIVSKKPKGAVEKAMRPPQLCKGCPHRLVFKALSNAGLVVAGDIGCYTLGTLPPFSALHTCLCMGAGVTVHEGFRRAHFSDSNKVVGVVGDSTFVHSGITGLINAAYNNMKGLLFILDNSTTAMTGGQNHPATGKTITGAPGKKLVLEELCRSCGADTVDVIKPQRFKQMEALIQKRLSEDTLSVIIVRSPCLLIK